MQITGSCYCGGITFRALVDPEAVTICHCTDCQKLTGTAYRVSVPAPADTLKIEGTPKTFIKQGDSGRSRRHGFCGDCGSPIYSAAAENPTAYSLRVGLIEQRAELAPRARIWCRSAPQWSLDVSGLPGSAREGG